MTDIKDGGPAFAHGNPEQGGHPGMSLRDYFAGQALAGWLASFGPNSQPIPEGIGEFAYEIADAMLRAREQGEG